jgi:uncharacterized protein YacL
VTAGFNRDHAMSLPPPNEPRMLPSDTMRLGLRLLGLAVGIAIGWQTGSLFARLGGNGDAGDPLLVVVIAIGTIGYILGPRVSWTLFRNLQAVVKGASVVDLVAVAVGLAFGGLVAALLAVPLALLPSPYGAVLPLVAAVAVIALAIAVVLLRKRDLIVPVIRGRLLPRAGLADPMPTRPDPPAPGTLLDTSVIIDGRLPDLLRTGVLDGPLYLPRFILEELQHIADAEDPMRRARGRRGLDTLNRLRQDDPDRLSTIEIAPVDLGPAPPKEVDAKLVRVAKLRGLRILTNDYNLDRVARIEGVRVLNLHELAGALRPPVVPGEELNLKLIQEGREAGQAVGFLADGTMVVVDGGRPLVGQQASVTVTRLLQTGAGRMVFAVPKHARQTA